MPLLLLLELFFLPSILWHGSVRARPLRGVTRGKLEWLKQTAFKDISDMFVVWRFAYSGLAQHKAHDREQCVLWAHVPSWLRIHVVMYMDIEQWQGLGGHDSETQDREGDEETDFGGDFSGWDGPDERTSMDRTGVEAKNVDVISLNVPTYRLSSGGDATLSIGIVMTCLVTGTWPRRLV